MPKFSGTYHSNRGARAEKRQQWVCLRLNHNSGRLRAEARGRGKKPRSGKKRNGRRRGRKERKTAWERSERKGPKGRCEGEVPASRLKRERVLTQPALLRVEPPSTPSRGRFSEQRVSSRGNLPHMHIPVLVPFMCKLHEQHELDAYKDEASDGSHIAPGCKRRPSKKR